VATAAVEHAEWTAPSVQPAGPVVACYSAVDKFFSACGLVDLTEGIYHGDPATPYETAQANQHEYLLSQVQLRAGGRLLDIGCGYGTLLERAVQRGAHGVGITLTPVQAAHCRRRGLNVRLMDYRRAPREWDRTFDAVIANGSLEHFVLPRDVAAGRADAVYRHLFATVHRLIDPESTARRFATTAIHVLRPPSDPRILERNPLRLRRGSDDFHWAIVQQGWGGGYYPELGQLERCAAGYFDLAAEVDGTEDYRLTSEEWLRQVRATLGSRRAPMIGVKSLPVMCRAPRQYFTLLFGFLATESWNWQFRPPTPPTRLLRQTWVYRERQRRHAI
jgi:cyclopropane-fatty-acyl-phospholipid synthase